MPPRGKSFANCHSRLVPHVDRERDGRKKSKAPGGSENDDRERERERERSIQRIPITAER
jgi:hypothetical protein